MQAQKKQVPVPVIFDTDMGPDYDDVGAVTLLHAFADSGKAKILATIASTNYEGVAAVLNTFNTYFKRPGIPVGVAGANALALKDRQHWTDTVIKKYPHAIKNNADAYDAVDLYRQVLSKQTDASVTIITVGFLTNLHQLLLSKPDKWSALDGKALVKQKVKLLLSMAGKFPSGYEFNVKEDAPASRYVYDNWETPVILSGFEIGMKIKTGMPLISNKNIVNSPVKDVFALSIPLAAEDSAGRMSWDETAVLVAVLGYKNWYRLEEGKITVAADGKNDWVVQPSKQARLIEAVPTAEVQAVINQLMMHQPR